MSEKIKTIQERIASSIEYADSRLERFDSHATDDERDAMNELFTQFMINEPKPIVQFVPGNAAEQKALFLSGAVRNPDHTYPKLETIDFDENIEALERKMRSMLVTQSSLKPVQESAFRSIADRFVTMTRFMKSAVGFKSADTDAARAGAAQEYTRYNKEVYGEPDEAEYKGIMRKYLTKIQSMELDERGEKIREELFSLLDVNEFTEGDAPEIFAPSEETVAWVHDITMHLYGPWFGCIPEEKEEFSDQEIQQVFQEILDTQFDGAADGWKVVIRAAQSINVRAPEKEIIIPPGTSIKLEKLKRLICHEVGIHVLRSVVGEQTDSPQLRIGTASYYDVDEGLGVVMEDAYDGKYKEHGEMYYAIAGLSHFNNTDFRDTYEIWSRIHTLIGAEGKTVDDEFAAKKESFAYGNVMRIMRGTDELPWFKDLGYYNGANKIWQYLEKHRGDDLMFMLLISSGKIDPDNNDDRLLALEARSL